MPMCDPADLFETILECDNTDGVETTTFTYEQKMGTEFSESVSMSASVGLEYRVSAQSFLTFDRLL
jgi:hypothetical protein